MLTTQPIQPNDPHWTQVEALAREAFPPKEYLPPVQLARMAQAANFDFLALEEDRQFVGFVAVQTHQDMAYLFFLAIVPGYRSKGYGSKAIETLKRLYPGKTQVVDFEMPDAAAPNAPQRIKRRAFYLRNGYKPTGLFLSYLGVDYEVMCMGENFDPDTFKALMGAIHVESFNPIYFILIRIKMWSRVSWIFHSGKAECSKAYWRYARAEQSKVRTENTLCERRNLSEN